MMKLKAKIHNRFDVFRKDVRTGKEEQIAYAENIILDQWWTLAYAQDDGQYWASHIFIGSGTGMLNPARTSLFTQIAKIAVTSTAYAYDDENLIFSARRSANITEAQYVGETIREIGIGGRYKNYLTEYLFSHALLLDMNGNPVSILKTATDIITFYATWYVVLEETSFNNGKSLLLLPKESVTGANNWPELIQFLTNRSNYYGGSEAGRFFRQMTPAYGWGETNLALSSTPTVTRDGINKKYIVVFPRVTAAQANDAGGIHCCSFSPIAYFKFTGHPDYPGTFVSGEQVGTGDGSVKDFKTAFGLVKSGAIVKIDGVEDPTAVIDTGKPYSNDLIRYINIIEFSHLQQLPGYATAVMNSMTNLIGEYSIIENPYYATYGIDSMLLKSQKVYASNNLSDWTEVASRGSSQATVTINAPYNNYRYFKFVAANYDRLGSIAAFLSNDLDAAELNNVHLSSAPAEGSVITVDYTTEVVAKDANHVFDFSFEVDLAEYTEEY